MRWAELPAKPPWVVSDSSPVSLDSAPASRGSCSAPSKRCRRALRLLILVGVLMLLGIVGAIALHNSLGLACIVVVVPVCSIALGALGQRWYSALGGQQTHRVEGPAAEAAAPELQRSVEYVDKKLTFALNAFGAERHQHAMIALFQAKTAVELTLGTEQDADMFLALDEHTTRPRIRAGGASRSSMRESTSLAAS